MNGFLERLKRQMQKMICQGEKTQIHWTGNGKVLLRLIFAVFSFFNSNMKQ